MRTSVDPAVPVSVAASCRQAFGGLTRQPSRPVGPVYESLSPTPSMTRSMWRIESRRTEILIGVAAEPIAITTAKSSRDSIDPTNVSPPTSSTCQSPPPAGGSPVGRGKRMPRIASRGNTNGSANAGDRHQIAPCGLSPAAGSSASVPAMNPSSWRSRTAAIGSVSGAAAAAGSTCAHATTARRTAHRNRIASRLRWLVAARIEGTVVMGALKRDRQNPYYSSAEAEG